MPVLQPTDLHPATAMTQHQRPKSPRSSSASATRQPGTGKIAEAAQQVRSWAEAALCVAGNVADMSLTMAKVKATDPKHKAAIAQAGRALRRTREAAGLTTAELEQVIGLGEAGLLENAESGKATLPFEVILRLASVLGRHDPIAFAMRLTRSYNPELWDTLDRLGVGLLAVQAGRERELANIYRANDAARGLSDEQFARVLSLMKTSFEMAIEFAASADVGKKQKASKD